MPRIRYPEVITESVAELLAVERAARGQRNQPRVAMLWLLKSGQARARGRRPDARLWGANG